MKMFALVEHIESISSNFNITLKEGERWLTEDEVVNRPAVEVLPETGAAVHIKEVLRLMVAESERKLAERGCTDEVLKEVVLAKSDEEFAEKVVAFSNELHDILTTTTMLEIAKRYGMNLSVTMLWSRANRLGLLIK